MQPVASFTKSSKLKADTVVLMVGEGGRLTDKGQALEKETKGAISHFIKTSNSFTGKTGQVAALPGPQKFRHSRIALLGVGKLDKLDASEAAAMGGRFYAAFSSLQPSQVLFHAEGFKGLKSIDAVQATAHFPNVFVVRSYNYDKYKTNPKVAKVYKPLKKKIMMYEEAKETANYM